MKHIFPFYFITQHAPPKFFPEKRIIHAKTVWIPLCPAVKIPQAGRINRNDAIAYIRRKLCRSCSTVHCSIFADAEPKLCFSHFHAHLLFADTCRGIIFYPVFFQNCFRFFLLLCQHQKTHNISICFFYLLI